MTAGWVAGSTGMQSPVTYETAGCQPCPRHRPRQEEVTAAAVPSHPAPGRQSTRSKSGALAPRSLLRSVNDAVNVLPCSTCAYLNGGPLLTCAAFPGRR
jgi:hypothetical protein